MLIGRKREQQQIMEAFSSSKSEFMVVYGRCSVGKTYLVGEVFNYNFAFEYTSTSHTPLKSQLKEFKYSLEKNGFKAGKIVDWIDAFHALQRKLEDMREGRKVLFIDEIQWLDTPRSGFIPALEHFWNGWAVHRKDILLIVCGSSTSWIINELVQNYGGLHNRITYQIRLEPFTLHECELMAQYSDLQYPRYQLLEAYMILGGVPFYWSLMKKGLSLAQNIDNLFFSSTGQLRNEFNSLYASLFKNADPYINIVMILGQKKVGMTMEEITKEGGIAYNGNLTRILSDLEYCGFIRKYNSLGYKKKEAIYQLIDNFTLFYFKYMQENSRNDENFWSQNIDSPLHNAWTGLAFERVCLQHTKQIKKALGIAGVESAEYSWISKRNKRKEDGERGVQIDLLIDRKDQVINMCEMKYSREKYEIDDEYAKKLIHKKEVFIKESGTTSAVHTTMVTVYGIKHNINSGIVQKEITAEDLFAE